MDFNQTLEKLQEDVNTAYALKMKSGRWAKSTQSDGPLWWPSKERAEQANRAIYGNDCKVVKVKLIKDTYAYNGYNIQEAQVKNVNYKDENELDSLEADTFKGNKSVKVISKDKIKKTAKVMVGSKAEIDTMTKDKSQLASQLGLTK